MFSGMSAWIWRDSMKSIHFWASVGLRPGAGQQADELDLAETAVVDVGGGRLCRSRRRTTTSAAGLVA